MASFLKAKCRLEDIEMEKKLLEKFKLALIACLLLLWTYGIISESDAPERNRTNYNWNSERDFSLK